MRWVVVTVELAVAAFVTSVTASGPHEPDQQRGAEPASFPERRVALLLYRAARGQPHLRGRSGSI